MKLDLFPQEFVNATLLGLHKAELDQTRPILIAFSGGPDSTALLLACKVLSLFKDLQITAAHFNHRLRPEQDQQESTHVQKICATLSVRLLQGEGDTRKCARLNRTSLEEEARELRYRFFAAVAKKVGAQGVTTAHTTDDQAETVILNLIRGTGIHGLRAMRPKMVRKPLGAIPALNVLRPLLEISKKECKAACEVTETPFISDPSNLNTKFIRNRVRHEILPAMKDINPQSTASIARLAGHSHSALEIIEHVLEKSAAITNDSGAVVIDKKAFHSLKTDSLRLFALRDAISKTDTKLPNITEYHLRAMKELAESGKIGRLSLPRDFEFISTYQQLIIANKGWKADNGEYPPAPLPEVHLNQNGTTKLGGGFQIGASTLDPIGTRSSAKHTPRQVYLDAENCDGDLLVRKRRAGDRFMPLGMKTEVKLQDFFVNNKLPVWMRDRVPIIEGSKGILWVAGLRIADWAKVTDTTKKILKLEFTRVE